MEMLSPNFSGDRANQSLSFALMETGLNGAQMNEAEENVNERLCSKNKVARLAVSQSACRNFLAAIGK